MEGLNEKVGGNFAMKGRLKVPVKENRAREKTESPPPLQEKRARPLGSFNTRLRRFQIRKGCRTTQRKSHSGHPILNSGKPKPLVERRIKYPRLLPGRRAPGTC